ncbi:hypothetical protein TI04_08405 [Achromatium sp. WMS2]|nr:hypothetical protein TI04_08405 [Achromatium sp. WMS2]
MIHKRLIAVFCYGGFIMSKLDEDIRHGHYLIHPDGTVTDTRNGLMWKRCAEGQTWDGKTCVGNSNKMKWNDIMRTGWFSSPKQKSWPAFAGYKDWRMPTIEELRTLVYCSSGNQQTWNDTNEVNFRCKGDYQKPTIDQVAFPNTDSTWFWSASAFASDSSSAWSLGFSAGYGGWNYRSDAGQVRLVRVGQ